MQEDDFKYKPLNSSSRPKPSLLKNFPKIKLSTLKQNGKWSIKKILLTIGITFGALFAVGVISVSFLIAVASIGLPNIKDLDSLYVAQSTTIYDREGNVLYVKFGGENRKYIPYNQISNHIINATIAIEDDQFWTHSGFNIIGITRAFVNNIMGGSQQGGSTLTQQYIKNAFLSSEKTYGRKLKELILSVQLEQTFSKEEILELYLNKIPYGNNAFGVEKASEVYFGKSAKELNLPESVILASIPKAPSYYNPYGLHRYSELKTEFTPEEIKKRKIKSEADLLDNEFYRGLIGKNIAIDEETTLYIQGRTDLVLKAMIKEEYISEEEMKKALEELKNIEFKEYRERMLAPHFVFHVLENLENTYGKEIVEQGGLQVYTTLDPQLQKYAQDAIDEIAPSNKTKYNAKNAALTSIDPKTGQILAMVGSVNYWSEEIDGAVNVATSYKQPGSSFKPIVYAKAFYNRYSPSSIIFDVRTEFGVGGYPDNYDGKFLGPINIRTALGQSRNITAIKTYFLANEQEGIIDLSQKMGINFLNPSMEYGWPLALGTGEVRQLDLASAFGIFANSGIKQKPSAIIKVTNSQNEVLEEWKESEGEEVLDPQIAYLITDILADTSVNLGPYLNIQGHKVAVKTGTANKKKGSGIIPSELWTVGYTPSLVTAVWTGNNKAEDGDIARSASGYVASAPIWNKFMTNALKNTPSEEFKVPEGIKHERINKLTGKLAGPNTPEALIIDEIFASFSVPTEIDDGFTTIKIDTRNSRLANEYCPEKFTKEVVFIALNDIAPFPSWQEGANKWMEENSLKILEEQNISSNNIIVGSPPNLTSELCTQERMEDKPKISIISPTNNETFKIGEPINVEVNITSVNGIENVEYYLDGIYKYSTSKSPYTGIIRMPKNEKHTNQHLITVKAIDTLGYSSEEKLQIITSDSENNTTNNKPEDPKDPSSKEDPKNDHKDDSIKNDPSNNSNFDPSNNTQNKNPELPPTQNDPTKNNQDPELPPAQNDPFQNSQENPSQESPSQNSSNNNKNDPSLNATI